MNNHIRGSILFHHPRPIIEEGKSGGRIRPYRMLQAFRSLGYEVDLVSGNTQDRSRAIAKIKQKIKKGHKYHFMYAESSTMPTALSDDSHFPSAPLMDASFFGFIKKSGIPIGLFYRDIYWRFEDYKEKVAWHKRMLAVPFFKHDLKWYERTLTKLYLPTVEMGGFLPKKLKFNISELPPAYDEITTNAPSKKNNNLIKLLYIGGLSNHYRMHKLFEAVENLSKVELIVCTRQAEWSKSGKEYKPWLSDNIKIVHLSGKELSTLFNQADMALVFIEPGIYWSFAAPVKVFEYLGNGKPIIASKNTWVGRFVTENDLGWAINYDVDELKLLLKHLLSHPQEIQEKSARCKEQAALHTWQARAKQVAEDLDKVLCIGN